MTAENEAPEDLMDVIDHAIETGDVGSNQPEDSNDEPQDDLESGSDDAVADGDDAEGGDEPEGDEGEGEEGEGGERPRGPDGKFLKPGEKAQTPEEKAAAEAKGKKADPLNDPIPKELNQQTQDRIRTLIKSTREATQSAEQARGNFDEIIKGIQATGTTPEQYREVLSFMALFNSNHAESQMKALELIEGMADRLATYLGVERQTSDVLSKHNDLREAVAAGKITPAYAKEIARTRAQQGFRSELETQATEHQRAQAAEAQAKNEARASLNQLEATLKATDPDYERKKAQLVPILQTIFPTVHPSQWAARFQDAYKKIVLAPNRPTRPTVPGRQPLRAGGSVGRGAGRAAGNSGGMGKDAGSMLDAVNDALAAMPR